MPLSQPQEYEFRKGEDEKIHTRSDSEIAEENDQVLLWDVRVDDNLIDVDVKDGKVTLTGSVGSAREKSRAEANARMVAGVKDVDASGLGVRFGHARRPFATINMMTCLTRRVAVDG